MNSVEDLRLIIWQRHAPFLKSSTLLTVDEIERKLLEQESRYLLWRDNNIAFPQIINNQKTFKDGHY